MKRFACACVVSACALAGPGALADEALFLPVESFVTIDGVGLVVEGYVARGSIAVGDSVDIVGVGRLVSGTAAGLQRNLKDIDVAEAGSPVNVLLQGVEHGDLARGQVMVAPGTDAAHHNFTADVTARSDNYIPLPAEIDGRIRVWTASSPAKVTFAAPLDPGATAQASIALEVDTAFAVGDEFKLRIDDTEVAMGVVTSIED